MSDEMRHWATVALRDGVLVYTDLFCDEGNEHERAEAFERLFAHSRHTANVLTFYGFVCHRSENVVPPPSEDGADASWLARGRLVTITPDRINYIAV